jgi:methylmalonyl-CoA/ethylmalonyl-CoA epimerase
MGGANPSRVAQVAIPIEDLERAKSFYGDVLGLEHLFDAPPGLSFFRCGETRLMLSRPEGVEAAGSSILYYGVEDVGSAYRAMKEKGAAFDEEPRCIARVEEKDIWLAVCRDGEGNLLGLISG